MGGRGGRDQKNEDTKKKTATGGSSNPHAAKGGERLKWPTDSNPTLRLCVVASPLTHTHNTRYLLARARAQGQPTNRREWTCWLRQLETAQQTLFFRQQHHRWIISGKKSKGISFYTTRRRSYHRYLLECIHLIV